LKEDVEKHNGVMEREYKLESDVHTAFKRIDELKDRDEKIEARIERLHEKE
jgi:cell division protein FtsB